MCGILVVSTIKRSFIMKKILSIILSVLMLLSFTGCGNPDTGENITPDNSIIQQENSQNQYDEHIADIDKDGRYFDKENVAKYIYTYGHLPYNFITKDEARDLGWEGGSVEEYAPGYAIGGDVFGNREGLLPQAKGRIWYECDIDTDGYHSRGSRRIVFSSDGLIYYTHDHYESCELLYGKE